MSDFYVKIGKDKVMIEKEVFLKLLDFSPIKKRSEFKQAIKVGGISLDKLKTLAAEASVPYPLFFALNDHIEEQIANQNKCLAGKLPSKHDISLSSRGKMKMEDIFLIIKDLAKKQEFFKKRVLSSADDNDFIGMLVKLDKQGASESNIADSVRNFFDIQLEEIQRINKSETLKYLTEKIEQRNILVSRSSYNFMPQNIQREVFLSGICVKDKKFPYIFINTRDGDARPLILETDGRQIFTLVLMLVCIGLNKFILSSKENLQESDLERKVYSIAAEVLLPITKLQDLLIKDVDDLIRYATDFSVTPSMLLVRLKMKKMIDPKLADQYLKILEERIQRIPDKKRRSPVPETGFAKYNGTKFSKEIISAYNQKRITREEISLVLFKKRRISDDLLDKYRKKFKEV